MKNYKLEDIQYLRAKTPISYEEAVILLDKHDGDMAGALVELEKKGLLGNKNSSTNRKDNNNDKGFWENISNGLKFLFSKHMLIAKGEKVMIDLPLAVWILLSIIIFPILLIGALLVLIFGLRIDFNNTNNHDIDIKIDSFINKASSAVKSTMNNSGDAKKSETKEGTHNP